MVQGFLCSRVVNLPKSAGWGSKTLLVSATSEGGHFPEVGTEIQILRWQGHGYGSFISNLAARLYGVDVVGGKASARLAFEALES